MSRLRLLSLFALVVLSLAVPVRAAEDEEGDKKFTIHGEARVRWEYFENLVDLLDNSTSGDSNDDAYDIWPYRVRIAAHGQFSDDVIGHVELQNFGVFGNEDPFKTGTDPLSQTSDSGPDQDDTNLYQGYIELDNMGGSKFSLRVGRQEHVLGNELQIGDLDFYNGQSFDGVHGWWDWDSFDLNAFFYNVAETNAGSRLGFPCGGNCGDDNTTFSGVTFNWGFGENQDQVLEPYILYYRSGDETASFFAEKLSVYTLGARYTRPRGESNAWDWNAEFALQNGNIGVAPFESDQKAYLFEGWFGYNFGEGSRHRVHLGTLISSGDKEDAQALTDDGDHEDYLFLFPDFHANNRLGDLDTVETLFNLAGVFFGGFTSSGITDWNVGYEFWGSEGKHAFMAAYHMFQLTEGICTTCPGPIEDDLGDEIDFMYGYRYSDRVGFQVGLAQFSPGDVFAGFTLPAANDDSALRTWAQLRLTW